MISPTSPGGTFTRPRVARYTTAARIFARTLDDGATGRETLAEPVRGALLSAVAVGGGVGVFVIHGKFDVAKQSLHVALQQTAMVRGFAARGRTRAGTLAHVGDVAFDAFGTSPGAGARARRFARARSAPRRAPTRAVPSESAWDGVSSNRPLRTCTASSSNSSSVAAAAAGSRGGRAGFAGRRARAWAPPPDARAAAWARAGRRAPPRGRRRRAPPSGAAR